MKKAQNNLTDAEILRQKAEEQLKKQQSKVSLHSSENGLRKLAQELQVHQIELEMQYEQLKKAKEEADTATQKYTELYDFAPSGYFTLTKLGEIIGLNLHGAIILGKERLHLINRRFGSSVSDLTKPIFNNFLDKVFESKGDESCELTLSVESKNVPTYVYLTGHVLENGEQCQINVVDITKRKQSEKALFESEERFRFLFNQAPLGYQALDFDGNFMEVNQTWLNTFGYTHEEVVGKWFGDFLSPAYLDGFRQRFSIFKAQGHIHSEFEMVHKNGNILFIAFEGKIGYDNNGKFKQTHCILQDITERKQAELALKEREKEFRSLAESMPQIVWTTRADGWNTYFNQQWVDYTGLTLEESYGHGWNTPFHPEDKQRAWDAWQNAVKNNAEYSIECRLRCHDGMYHWWLIRGVPQISAGGEIIKWFGTCTDIEKIKVAELALKESEKQLLRLSVDKDRFISILGHDLKNPFNNILGFSEILTDEIERLDKEQIKDIAGTINKSARITNKLLEDILMWARTQQGSFVFKPQNLSLSTTFRNSLEILNPSADAKNILINCSEVDHLDVFADADMLKTVLRNLVSNAIKFTNNGGKINIRATQSDSNVTISVSDNGVGIPHENLAKLFDITEVFTTKGTAGETGTGLGLLLCKEFVGRHQGKIWVESEVGKGSDFKFTLPVNI